MKKTTKFAKEKGICKDIILLGKNDFAKKSKLA